MMPDFVLGHTQQWMGYFARQGHHPEPLAEGVEGAIYDLGGGLVAKVWRDRCPDELQRMQAFYADVATAGLPFGTPEILKVELAGSTSVTYERKLPGTPLQARLALEDQEIGPEAIRCVTDVLRALASVPAVSSMRQLAVLGEDEPFRADPDTFGTALLSMLSRRAARFGKVIRERLPDFDRRRASLVQRITLLSTPPDTVIHGDLLGGNILVDDRARALAVLDFGFLTTAGDPRLDAAIAAAVMNMYGPHALAITRHLSARFAEDLGYPPDVLLIYQAAYAMATSNAFTPDGSDGHFAWCIDQLRRPEISAVLGV